MVPGTHPPPWATWRAHTHAPPALHPFPGGGLPALSPRKLSTGVTYQEEKGKHAKNASALLTERQAAVTVLEETQIFSVGCFGVHFNHWAWGSHNLGLTDLKGLSPLT